MSSSQTSSSSSEPAPVAASVHPLANLFDVTCAIDVVVGTASISVRDCLKLRRNSVIRLRRPAGSDLTITSQGVPIAVGEVVVDDDRTAVRISVIAAPPGSEVVE